MGMVDDLHKRVDDLTRRMAQVETPAPGVTSTVEQEELELAAYKLTRGKMMALHVVRMHAANRDPVKYASEFSMAAMTIDRMVQEL